MSQDASRIGKLILVPAVITLGVTLLRLAGELQGWSTTHGELHDPVGVRRLRDRR